MAKFSVKKPFTILVAVIMVLVLGVVSLTRMTTDLLPNMTLPYMMVITTYPGASPEKVENDVSKPMESALGTVSGVKNVYSVSAENYSMVQLEFEDDTNMDSAMVKVSSALDTVKPILPDLCGTPSIMELSMDMMATMYLSASYEGMDIYQLSSFVEDEVVPYLERQAGVASVSTVGLVEKSVQVELNQAKVDALNDKILAKTNDAFADAISDLADARQKLVDNQEKLDESKQSLIDSTKDLQDNEDELWDSKRQLEDGISAIKTAISQTQAARDGLGMLLDNSEATLSGLEQGEQARSAVVAQMNALVELQSQYTAGDETALEAYEIESLRALGLVVADDATRSEAAAALESAYSAAQLSLNAIDDGLRQALGAYEGLRTAAGLSASGLSPETLTPAKIQNIRTEWPAMLGSATSYMRTLTDQLNSQKKSLEGSEDQLDDALDKINDGREQIDDGWESVSEGQEQLDDGWENYNKSLKTFNKQRAEALKKANADSLVSIDSLSKLIYAQNFEMPAGYIDDQNDNSWLLKVGENFADLDELSGIVLCKIDDIGDVRLCDVADVTIIDNAEDSYGRLNGEQAVILSVFKSSTSGTNEVSKTCNKAMQKLEADNPGLSLIPMTDQGSYITLIVNSVLQSILIGSILAIIVLALFLKDVKPTLVVALSIPFSVLTALVAMYFSGISLNMMTLSGLSLGIGMLVDNSIVVIENIYRLRGRGVNAARASVQGTRQVAGAIIASTLTTVCVFLPMIFTTGIVRKLMMPMCLTIIYCLTASLLVAMTVVPATGSTLLKKVAPKRHPLFDKVQNAYGRLLKKCLRVKIVPLAVAIVLLAFSGWQVVRMGLVMIPEMNSNQLAITVTMPDDMSKEDAYATADQVMDAILPLEGVESVGAMTAGTTASMVSSSMSGLTDDYLDYLLYVTMTQDSPGANEVDALSDQILDATQGLNCTVEVSAGMDMSAMISSGLSISIYGDDLETLQSVSEDVMELVGQVDGFTNIKNGQEEGDDVIHLILDKDAAMRLGLSVAQIYQELSSKLTVSATSTSVTIDGVQMDVSVKDEMNPLTVENLMDYTFDVSVTDEDDDTVTETHRLGEFASVRNEVGVASVNRENQTRYMTVTAEAEEGYNTTLLSRELEPLLENYQAPDGYLVEMGGESEDVNQMVVQMCGILGLGLLFIYLVMVAQFQSLLSPFIVLFTVPLAFTGGLLGLLFTGEQLSIMSMMGFVVLLGTVVNNGIVFVDYANQLRMGGMERRAALIATGKTRMRPILMTALTTILAMSKLIAGDDMGSQMGRGMAIVVVGGLAYATLMTLFIIPIMYDIFFKRNPRVIDVGSDNIDDVPDDAAEFIQQNARLAAEAAGTDTAADKGVSL